MEDGMKIVSDRWMLQSRQIVNWGSYGGWHEFRPSMDGTMPVTLLAGASESGKSTLVDAQISLLYPSGTPYNKASNSGRSERNDYTYLRGMIGVNDSENGETPIFPVQIFKVKEGVNYNEGDPNYDLFKLAMRVSAKRLFPNFSFLDAPFNLQYYKPGDYNTEVATWAAAPASWAMSTIPRAR